MIVYLKNNHNKIIVTSRNKDVTNHLLEHSGIEFICISEFRNNIGGMIIELIQRDYRIFQLHREINFDASIGSTVFIAHLATLFNVPSYNFGEDDDDIVPLSTYITFPFTSKIINPDCVRFNKWCNKRVLHSSYHELAYLHPNNFTPNPSVVEMYGLELRNYIIIRLSAFNAHHDLKNKGISESLYRDIINILSDYTLIVSDENTILNSIKPWHMHHLLSYAKMMISDS